MIPSLGNDHPEQIIEVLVPVCRQHYLRILEIVRVGSFFPARRPCEIGTGGDIEQGRVVARAHGVVRRGIFDKYVQSISPDTVSEAGQMQCDRGARRNLITQPQRGIHPSVKLRRGVHEVQISVVDKAALGVSLDQTDTAHCAGNAAVVGDHSHLPGSVHRARSTNLVGAVQHHRKHSVGEHWPFGQQKGQPRRGKVVQIRSFPVGDRKIVVVRYVQ